VTWGKYIIFLKTTPLFLFSKNPYLWVIKKAVVNFLIFLKIHSMTKVWWEKILHNYPQALESCKLYFQHRYQDQWRNQIQNPLVLIDFFKDTGIAIYVHWKHHQSGKKYGYKIKQENIKIQMDYIFGNQEAASVNALEFAFKILEWGMVERNQRRSSFYPGGKVNRRTK
jgi:hypothetical protein